MYAARRVSLSPIYPFFQCPILFFLRWAIPVCLLTSWIYMRTKYHWTQIFVWFILLITYRCLTCGRIGSRRVCWCLLLGLGCWSRPTFSLVRMVMLRAAARETHSWWQRPRYTALVRTCFIDIPMGQPYLVDSEFDRRILRETFADLRGVYLSPFLAFTRV
jgi:hypothetical protein